MYRWSRDVRPVEQSELAAAVPGLSGSSGVLKALLQDAAAPAPALHHHIRQCGHYLPSYSFVRFVRFFTLFVFFLFFFFVLFLQSFIIFFSVSVKDPPNVTRKSGRGEGTHTQRRTVWESTGNRTQRQPIFANFRAVNPKKRRGDRREKQKRSIELNCVNSRLSISLTDYGYYGKCG